MSNHRAEFGNDFPEAAAIGAAIAHGTTIRHDAPTRRDSGPIADAFDYATDRLDRVEHVLGDLNGIIERLGYDLRPVLAADGDTLAAPCLAEETAADTAKDRRSTVARRITGLGDRADQLANITGLLRDKVAGLVEALELEGVIR